MFPKKCPSCGNNLKVEKLICNNCNTEIRGEYSLPLLMKLSESEQEFIIQFLLYSGSLKKMAKKLKVSYPTVRNRLDDLQNTINQFIREEEGDNE